MIKLIFSIALNTLSLVFIVRSMGLHLKVMSSCQLDICYQPLAIMKIDKVISNIFLYLYELLHTEEFLVFINVIKVFVGYTFDNNVKTCWLDSFSGLDETDNEMAMTCTKWYLIYWVSHYYEKMKLYQTMQPMHF